MFKKTSAFIKGTWDGTPDASNFTQDSGTFATVQDFVDYVDSDILAIVEEFSQSGELVASATAMSADGKVMIATKEYINEAAQLSLKNDSRWAAENAVTKMYDVQEAPAPEDVGTFDEDNRIYYHSSAHLF